MGLAGWVRLVMRGLGGAVAQALVDAADRERQDGNGRGSLRISVCEVGSWRRGIPGDVSN